MNRKHFLKKDDRSKWFKIIRETKPSIRLLVVTYLPVNYSDHQAKEIKEIISTFSNGKIIKTKNSLDGVIYFETAVQKPLVYWEKKFNTLSFKLNYTLSLIALNNNMHHSYIDIAG